jgi:hypothetical protein
MACGDGREGISCELHALVGVEFTEEVIHIGAEVRSNHVGEKKRATTRIRGMSFVSR